MGLYIGLITGTSIDAVDAALVAVEGDQALSCRLLTALNYPIPEALRHQLDALTRTGPDELRRMLEADAALGELLAEAALAVAAQGGVEPSQVTAIGSHGQTLRHYPDDHHPQTLQVGDPNRVAERTGITTIADLRRRDMAAGGQGAPLVPALHAGLLRSHRLSRAVLNLGGIANVTLLPADPAAPVTGFDTGPANTLLDGWIRRCQGLDMDRGGAWAGAGRVVPELLEWLLGDPYFARPAPKSTGREYFNLEWLDHRLAEYRDVAPEDIQATLARLTADSAAAAIAPLLGPDGEVIVCGGGAHNPHLMRLLRERLAPRATVVSDERGVPADWVEAMAFAWLAHRTLQGLPGNVTAVTGARHGVVLGGIYPGGNGPPTV